MYKCHCDLCKKIINEYGDSRKEYIFTEKMFFRNGGFSYTKKEGHFCNIGCLVEYIKREKDKALNKA